MLLLSTKLWISDKISCMLHLRPVVSPAGRSVAKPGAPISGSMLSSICGYRHRRQRWCHILAPVFPMFVPAPHWLMLLWSRLPGESVQLTQECAWVGSSLPWGRRTQSIHIQTAPLLLWRNNWSVKTWLDMETPKPDIITTTNKGGAFLNCLDLTKVCFGCMQVEDLKACSGFCRGKTVQRGISYTV